MKSVGRMWRRLRIAAVVTVLFCMSAVMAMAAGNNIETGDGDVVTPTPGETIKGEVAISDEGEAMLPLFDEEDGKVRLYTYTIYDAEGKRAGTVEFRYGKQTGFYGQVLWITTGTSPVEISRRKNYFEVVYFNESQVVKIVSESWKSFFEGEGYTYEQRRKFFRRCPARPMWSGIKRARDRESSNLIRWKEQPDIK